VINWGHKSKHTLRADLQLGEETEVNIEQLDEFQNYAIVAFYQSLL